MATKFLIHTELDEKHTYLGFKNILLTVPRRYVFVDLLCFFCLVFAMLMCASVYMCLVVTCWERADLLALTCGVQLVVCHFPIGILGQLWYLIVSITELCILTYFNCM